MSKISEKYTSLSVALDERGVASLTLNRPEVHNAFNEVMINELEKAVNNLSDNPDVRVIILRGAGANFSAGGDLNWMKKAAHYTEAENWDDAVKLSNMFNSLNHAQKPVIALIHGAAMGGGAGLVACADIAIASITSKFAFSEVKLGLIPATISPFVLAAIGARAARRYFLTGERFDAASALQMGLIHQMVEESELDSTLEKTIGQILSSGPEAVSHAKDLIFSVSGKEVTQDLRQKTAELIAKRRASAEGQDGLSAFLEKRPAKWIK